MSVNIIKSNGDHEAKKFINVPTLQELQELIGGYIKIICLGGNRQMIVDEDGLLKGKLANQEASALAKRLIVGDIVILEGSHRIL